MATQLETFRLMIPEFALLPDLDVQALLDIAPHFIDPTKFEPCSQGLALVYQAASLAYDRNQSATGNSSGLNVSMEKEGDLTRSYGGSSSSSGRKKMPNIYEQALNKLTYQFAGSSIMTRFG